MPNEPFLAEPTRKFRRELRRYVIFGNSCPSKLGYHSASATVGYVESDEEPPACDEFCARDDARWPQRCVCGYAFAANDQWQWLTRRIYRNPGTGDEFTLSDAPIGAMWKTPGGMLLIMGADGAKIRGG
jgi:hypothetical protein